MSGFPHGGGSAGGGTITRVTSTDFTITNPTGPTANFDGPLKANLAAGGFKISGLANGTAATDAAAYGQIPSIQVPAPTGVAATDTTNIQTAINAAAGFVGSAPFVFGGVQVVLQEGVYVVTGLTLLTYTYLIGQGMRTTVIQLASGTNGNVITGQNFAALTGGNTNGGIYGWTIQALTIDGNASNNTSGIGLCVYGYQPNLNWVEIENCAQEGLYSEWGPTGSISSSALGAGKPEGRVTGLTIQRCNGGGMQWQGPSDSNFEDVIILQNGPAQTTTVAAGSNTVNVNTFAGAGVLNVASTAGWPTSGTLNVQTSTGGATITYTGVSGGNSFTGCTLTWGSGTLATSNAVVATNTVGIWMSNNAFQCRFINTHVWGQQHNVSIRCDVQTFFCQLESEAGCTDGLWLRSNGNVVMSSYLGFPSPFNSVCRIGDTYASVSSGDNMIQARCTGGIYFDKDSGVSTYDLHTFIASGTAFIGTPNYSQPNYYKVEVNGGGTIGSLSGGAGAVTPRVYATQIPRVLALSANSATPAINTDNYDVVNITGQSAAITSFTSSLTGSPSDGQSLRISVTGTGAVAFTWGTSFESSTVTLPTTTSGTNRLDMGFFWNAATSKWRCVAVA
jgi:hypothetical protein